MSTKFSRRHLFWIVPLAVAAVAGGGFAAKMMAPPPADLDLALSKATDNGLYVTTLASDVSPIPVGEIHTWTVNITSPDGTPAEGVNVAIDGGMPQHGHGLPTKPEVTTELGEGSYLIEGMKFNMDGWWTLTVTIDGASGSDTSTFNLVL